MVKEEDIVAENSDDQFINYNRMNTMDSITKSEMETAQTNNNVIHSGRSSARTENKSVNSQKICDEIRKNNMDFTS